MECDEDIGWYILRFMTNEQKEEVLSKIKDDEIINITL
jgi:hypothetical protein